MNQELQTFLLDLLKQVIAGIPFGTILSLVVYYALSKVKKKTIEFPTRVNDLSDKLNGFYEATKVMFLYRLDINYRFPRITSYLFKKFSAF